jgi:hypothetical protein
MEKKLEDKSNNELQTSKKELSDKYEEVRLEVVKVYDYWKHLEAEHNKVVLELRKRGL